MKILVLNCGSSSVKYKLLDMESNEELGSGGVEKIGMKGSFLKHKRKDGQKVMLKGEILEHQTAVEYILGVLTSQKHGAVESLEEINAVGHRVVDDPLDGLLPGLGVHGAPGRLHHALGVALLAFLPGAVHLRHREEPRLEGVGLQQPAVQHRAEQQRFGGFLRIGDAAEEVRRADQHALELGRGDGAAVAVVVLVAHAARHTEGDVGNLAGWRGRRFAGLRHLGVVIVQVAAHHGLHFAVAT